MNVSKKSLPRTYCFLIFLCGVAIMGLAVYILGIGSTMFTEECYGNIKFRLSKPDIDKNKQTNKLYPLVVFLHGAAERGKDNKKTIKGLTFLGKGLRPQARSFRKKFPCFVYVPQCPLGTSWEGEILNDVIETIEHLKITYPINTNRLYLIGYSMGGTGTYELASHYYDFNGQLFAGIIRLAGQGSFTNRVHEVIAKSSIWIHIGQKDTSLRVEKANEAYAMIKRSYSNPPEKRQRINISGQQGETFTLVIDGNEKIKKTEYFTMGHGISMLPFDNPNVLEWLFSQKLFNVEPE